MAEAPVPDRTGLRADCSRCFALCCVALPFARSADFAFDKPAGRPCLHLAEDFGCSIHADLGPRGFPGCTTYDCFGAGQQVAQHTYAGVSWRSDPGVAGEMFRVFETMQGLHELLWYAAEASALPGPPEQRIALGGLCEEVRSLTRSDAAALDALDLDGVRSRAVPLLRAVSEAARAGVATRRDLSGADLAGGAMPGADLQGANLRGALLIGADLRGADLGLADLTGADLRGADLRATRLATALFLTQRQVDAARGDADTALPACLERPAHWGRDT